jgi:hypothetical protein
MKTIDNFKDPQYEFLMNSYNIYNDYEVGIITDLEFPTLEHAFQAEKTDDLGIKKKIRESSLRDARKIGKSLKLKDNWDNTKLSIMHNLLNKKFIKTVFRSKLLETGDALLVAGGDVFWGQVDGVGENYLGKLLMKVRAGLVSEFKFDINQALLWMGWKPKNGLWSPSWDKNLLMDLKSACFHQFKMCELNEVHNQTLFVHEDDISEPQDKIISHFEDDEDFSSLNF